MWPSAGQNGFAPGGAGGAGSAGPSGQQPSPGGNGANGQVVLTYTATVPSAPPPPTTIIAFAGNSSATVTWTAPATDGGSPLTGFTVTSSPGGVMLTVGPTKGSAVLTGLTNGTPYTFTVVATNSIGNSAPSVASNSVTPAASSPPPSGTRPPTAADLTALQALWESQSIVVGGAQASLAQANAAYAALAANLAAIAAVSPLLSSPDQSQLTTYAMALGSLAAAQTNINTQQTALNVAQALLQALTDALAAA